MSSIHPQTLETRAKISAALKGKPKSPEHRAKISATRVGHFVSEETRLKHSNISAETREAIAAGQRGHIMPEATRAAIHSEESRAKRAVAGKKRVGPLAGGWRGGICPEGALIRASMDYDAWRLMVFTRDEFACQKCGDNKGGNLEAHHMDCFADFPEKRMDATNGITLCDDCHNEFHRRYGCFHNRKWQTDEFLAEGV